MPITRTRFYEFGEFRLDAEERVLYRQGTVVTLTHKTFDLLLVLLESNGRIMEREELTKAVWPDTSVDSSSLKKAVSALRHVLGDDPDNSFFIKTLPKRGYRFIATVSILREGRADLLIERHTTSEVIIEDEEIEIDDEMGGESYSGDGLAVQQSHPSTIDAESIEQRDRPTSIERQLPLAKLSRTEVLLAKVKQHPLAVILTVAIIAVGGVLLFSYYRANREDSLAVMPFTYTTADASALSDPDREYLADGLTESIIQSLSQVPRLKVIARSSVFRYKGREVDPQEVGSTLGVRKILTGRITQRGENLIISVELVDASDNRELWGHRYEVRVSDLLATQSEMSTKISEQLRVRLTGEDERRVARQDTGDIAAYQLYLKGRYFWNRRNDEDLQKAIGYFQQAVEKDPRYARAYAALGESYILLTTYSDTAPEEAASKAREAASKALELDDQIAEAHTALAEIALDYDFDRASAEREFKRAIEIGPNYATAHHWYGLALAEEGRTDEALSEVSRARELDPLSLSINTAVGAVLYYSRQYDRALDQFKRAIELNPDASAGSRLHLSDAYFQKGMYAEATAEMQKITASSYEPWINARLALIYARTGKRAEALKIVNEFEQNNMARMQYYIAAIYAALGEHGKAMGALEKDFQQRDPEVKWLKVDPLFDSIHSEPRFTELLRRLKLAA